jgi:hypothetical protein
MRPFRGLRGPILQLCPRETPGGFCFVLPKIGTKPIR